MSFLYNQGIIYTRIESDTERCKKIATENCMKPANGKKFHQGFFRPTNPKKYKGDPTKIVYRSSWELKVMVWLDRNDAIIEWSSEEMWIPYISPKDGQSHRYFVDFVVEMKTKDGSETHMIEVKPEAQIQPPKRPKKVNRRYVESLMTYAVNQAKWEMAEQFTKKRGWKFTLLNEYDIGIKTRKA